MFLQGNDYFLDENWEIAILSQAKMEFIQVLHLQLLEVSWYRQASWTIMTPFLCFFQVRM